MKIKVLLITIIVVFSAYLLYTTTKNPLNTSQTQNSVPMPSGESIVVLFFQLIDEGKVTEAVDMLSTEIAPDDGSKQTWAAQFNDIESAKITEIQPYDSETWNKSEQKYRVNLRVVVDVSAANAPIPYYGWIGEENIRWVTLIKDQDVWKINGIATGP